MPSIITCTLKNNSSHFSEVHVNIKKQYIQWNLTTFIPANLESGYMSELAICQSWLYVRVTCTYGIGSLKVVKCMARV